MANIHGEPLPDVTTPQASIKDSVDKGYETKDVDFPGVIRMLAYTFILVVGSFVSMIWMFNSLMAFEKSHDDMPSPLFWARQDPPEPRLLPSPTDTRMDPVHPLATPGVSYDAEKAKEDATLKKLGLEDAESDASRLPDSAIDTVLKSPEATGTTVEIPEKKKPGRGAAP